jgi:peroxiredoxin
MPISVGDNLPRLTLKTPGPNGPQDLDTAEFFGGKKVVLFAVPGAFTPTCSDNHLPSFVDHAHEILGRGVDAIACTAVNDAFVLEAWAKSRGAQHKVTMLADGNGDFASALGMELDGSSFGLGKRSKRYAAIVDDGVVQALFVENNPGQMLTTGADQVLAAL